MAEFVIYKFEKASISGVYKLQYIGEAPPGVDDDTARWTIYKLAYGDPGDGSVALEKIDVLSGVTWNDRAGLPWP
jgi:hypothetical protein